MKKWSTYLLSIVLIYAVCLILYYYVNNTLVFPHPQDVLKHVGHLLTMSHTYIVILSTAQRLIVSLLISFMLGMSLGILGGTFKFVEWLLKPIITILRTIPLASVILIIIIITGMSSSPYVICSLMITPVVYQAFLGGIKNIDSSLMDVWKLDSSLNGRVVKKVLIPTIIPFIVTAFIQSVGLGFKVLVMSEFLAQTKNSIGKELVSASNNVEYLTVMAWTIILIILVLIVEMIPKCCKVFKKAF